MSPLSRFPFKALVPKIFLIFLGGRLDSLQALQDSVFLFLVCLSEYILKGRKEAIFVVYL